MSSKNDKELLKEIRDLIVKQNGKLDQLINLATTLTDTMNEDMYVRHREASPMIFDPKEYD